MSKRIESIEELEAKGFVRQPDGSYRKQRLCAKLTEPACHPDENLGNTTNIPNESEATRGDLSGAGAACGSTANGMTPKPGTRVRQSKKPLMNKLETEWSQWLKETFPSNPIVPQAIRFRLGNGNWYKTDFVMFSPDCVVAYEVKGKHAFRGGFENLKVAASLYPWIKWCLVWKQDGQWMEQEILP